MVDPTGHNAENMADPDYYWWLYYDDFGIWPASEPEEKNPVIIPEGGGTWIPDDNANITLSTVTIIESIRFMSKDELPEMLKQKQGVEDFLDWAGTPSGQIVLGVIGGIAALALPIPGGKTSLVARVARGLISGFGAGASSSVAASLAEVGQMDENDFYEQMALCAKAGEGAYVVEINTIIIMQDKDGGTQYIRKQDYTIAYNGVFYAPDGLTGAFTNND